jgi:hypothetical protein
MTSQGLLTPITLVTNSYLVKDHKLSLEAKKVCLKSDLAAACATIKVRYLS